MAQHFHNVQALRGVACLMVVVGHLRAWDTAFGPGTPGLVAFHYVGFTGVDLFFVLSGFVITTTNRRHFGRVAAVPGYLFRRAWRIYPTYWAAMALAAVTVSSLFGSGPFGPAESRRWGEWAALAPLDGLNPVIGQAWTLTYELMFYAAFGVLLVLPGRAAAAGLAAWAAVVAAALVVPAPTNPWARLPLSPFVFEFLGGCAVAWLAGRGVRGRAGAALAAGLAWGTAGALLVAAGDEPYMAVMFNAPLRVLVFGPAAVLVVYAAVATEGRWRVPRGLLLAGDASYSLYLTHTTVFVAALAVGMKVSHTPVAHLTGLAATFAAALAVGYGFYALVERPLLNLGRRRRVEAMPRPAEVTARRAA